MIRGGERGRPRVIFGILCLGVTILAGCPFMFEEWGPDEGWSDEIVEDPNEAGLEGWPPEEIPENSYCGGPTENQTGAVMRSMSYDVEVQGEYVSAVMDVKLCGLGETPDEVIMRFPLPRGAVIHRASVFLALQDRWEEAETVGRREAESVYDDIVHPVETMEFNDPLLIEKIGLDLYRARLFPVDSWVGGRFRVHYAHLLSRTDEGRQLQIALEDPDSLPFDPNLGLRVSLSTEPEFWESGASTMDSGRVDEVTEGRFDADLGSGGVEILSGGADHDLVLNLLPSESLPPEGMLIYEPEAPEVADHAHIHWTPTFEDTPGLDPQPQNVVFVVDISGSMAGQKIAELRNALSHVLGTLTEDDWFGLVAFDNAVYTYQDSMASGGNAALALRFVQALASGGSTNMAAGLVAGAEIGLSSPLRETDVDILLVTDGLPTEGPERPEDILSAIGAVTDSLGGSVRIAACGIGYDLDQSFINDLVHPTGGEATFALDDSEITGQILDLFGRVQGGGLSHVTVVVAGDTEDPYEHRRFFPGMTFSLGRSGELSGDERFALELEGLSPDHSIVSTSTLVTTTTGGSEGLSRVAPSLAARAWSARWEQRIDEGGETAELVNEAVLLARRYGIVTRYTSMLALETPEMYDEYGVQRPERDLAGIAISDISSSRFDESRIGGQGATAMETFSDASTLDAGCTCRTAERSSSTPLAMLMAIAALLLMRRRFL